jgi:hypothetical protein
MNYTRNLCANISDLISFAGGMLPNAHCGFSWRIISSTMEKERRTSLPAWGLSHPSSGRKGRSSLAFAIGLVESQPVDVLECTQAALTEIWKGGDKGKRAKSLLDEILALSSNGPMRVANGRNRIHASTSGPSNMFVAMFGISRDDDDDPLPWDGSGTCPNAREYRPSRSTGEAMGSC